MPERRDQTRLAEDPHGPELPEIDHHGVAGLPVAQEGHHAVVTGRRVPLGAGSAVDDQGVATDAVTLSLVMDVVLSVHVHHLGDGV